MRSFIIFVLFFACIVYTTACKCAPLTQKQAFDNAEIVAKMNIVEKKRNGTQIVYYANFIDIYKPKDLFHIMIPVPIATSSSTASCGVTDLRVGKDYLISGRYNGQNQISINSCSGIPPADGQFSKPLGALDWKFVTPELLKKLESGTF